MQSKLYKSLIYQALISVWRKGAHYYIIISDKMLIVKNNLIKINLIYSVENKTSTNIKFQFNES